METQFDSIKPILEALKSFSYIFYGFCVIVAALFTVITRWIWLARKEQKNSFKEEQARALKLQEVDLKTKELEKNQANDRRSIDRIEKKVDDGFKDIEKKMDVKFATFEDVIREILSGAKK